MKVTPLDIRRKEFKRSMRGYADEEVDIFLDEVADEFERLFQENAEMNDRLQRLEEQLESYAQLKTALEKTLVSAQLQADQVTANARKESELIMRDAELQARNIVSESYGETQKVQQALVQLKHLEEDFRFKFRSLLEAHLKLLNDAPLAAPAPAAAAVAAAVVAPAVAPEEAHTRRGAAWRQSRRSLPSRTLSPMAPPPALKTQHTEPAQEEVAAAAPPAQTEPKVRWPQDDDQAQVEAETALAEGEVETEGVPAARRRTGRRGYGGVGIDGRRSDSGDGRSGHPRRPGARTSRPPEESAQVASESAVAAAGAQVGGDDEAQTHGFFFGKQMDDIDDSFVTMETPTKDNTRDFEW